MSSTTHVQLLQWLHGKQQQHPWELILPIPVDMIDGVLEGNLLNAGRVLE